MAIRKTTKARKPTNVKLVEIEVSLPTVVALCSTESCYRLSWLLNTNFPFKFQLYDNSNLPDLFLDISIYKDENEDVFLIPNKLAANTCLISSLKQFDYLLVSHNPSILQPIDVTLSSLRKLEGIVAVVEVEKYDKKTAELISLF